MHIPMYKGTHLNILSDVIELDIVEERVGLLLIKVFQLQGTDFMN
jgi:hypothetical protein